MGAGVARTPVRFCLDDAPADEASSTTMDEIASEQSPRDGANRAFVERARERCLEVR